jgi:5-bromo-4-chloroindolyl phosphate hydrolysis protein
MKKEVKIKQAAPIYGTAAVWLIYCLFFPLYKLWHFAILLVIGFGAYLLFSRIFPPKTEYIEEPVTTGNPNIDALLAEGERASKEMSRLRDAICNEKVKSKIGDIIKTTDLIFKDLLQDPSDYRQVKHFADFYLPTTIKLLQTYDRMGSIGGTGENVTGTMQRIEAILDTTLEGYRKQLDALFADQALDIETDITVLKSMMKKEGLAGRDF